MIYKTAPDESAAAAQDHAAESCRAEAVPAAEARPHTASPQADEAPEMCELRMLKILLAEDNAINQQVAKAMLIRAGHTVTIAANGAETLDLYRRGGFDLILLDCQMPKMDGFEAAHAIRALEQGTGKRIPIIALTAHANDEDRERCLKAGMDDYLPKPIERTVLLDTVQRAAARDRRSAAGLC